MPVPERTIALVAIAAAAIGGGILFSCDDLPVTTVTFRVDDPWTFAEPAMPLLVEVRGRPGRVDEEVGSETVVSAITHASAGTASRGSPRIRLWPGTDRRASA